MSETSFPVSDLLRRKFQTSLVIISLALCVAATVYILLFGNNIGFEILTMAEGKLTAGFSKIFSSFIFLIGVLSVIAGAIVVSFMSFISMTQKVRDIGLIKAAGCPNDLIFGYFMTQLLLIILIGCFLGVVFGILANYASIGLFNFLGIQISQKPVNFWLILSVFVLYFVLALIFGTKTILNVTKVEPTKAISPIYQLGLSKEPGFKVTSKSNLTIKIALRSLFRRKSATIRIILCLSISFTLATMAIAGGVIAKQTTESWVEKAIGRNIVLIAHQDICNQYQLLLSKFFEKRESQSFNYTEEKYLISADLLNRLNSTSGIISLEARLILEAHVKEIPGEILNEETADVVLVGDNREGRSLIVGVEPEKVLNEWFMDGKFLTENRKWEAVIGDSLAQKMFSMPLNQSIRLLDKNFEVSAVCLDPINNGNVTYVPLKSLQNVTGTLKPNIIMVKVNQVNRTKILSQINKNVKAVNSEFEIFELEEALDKNLSFLSYIWSIIMSLPLFSLAAASLCLIGYVMLTIAEQHQEFGILRAVGTSPKTIIKIISEQSFIILLSSCAIGIPIGIIITLLILIPEPIVTSYTILKIATWLFAALIMIFVASLYPAAKFARKPILEVMNKP